MSIQQGQFEKEAGPIRGESGGCTAGAHATCSPAATVLVVEAANGPHRTELCYFPARFERADILRKD